jgi:acyl-CoA synthetase (NDP forming)
MPQATNALAWRDAGPALRPGSIAIVGASPSSRWIPIFQEQIRHDERDSPLWLINPSRKEVNGHPCYPSVRETPRVPEHLLVLIPAERVVPLLEDAAAAGVKSATLYSAGWGESDDAGKARQAALAALIGRTGMSVCGPNCLGTISVREGRVFYPMRVGQWLKPGGLGVVFQSGALVYPFVRAAGERGAGMSYVASCGNEAGLDAADYMKFMIEDPGTTAIALLLEGVRSPDKFRAALEMAIEAGKPVAVMKVGRTERSHASTLTHTGALAGSTRVFDALCRRYGVAQCDSMDQLVETSRLLAEPGRRPAGRRAVFLTFSGSLRSFVLDAAPEAGIELPALAPATVAALNTLGPLDLRISNPTDVGYVQATQAEYVKATRTLLADPGVDLVIVQEHPPDEKRGRSGAAIGELAATSDKPLVLMSETAFSHSGFSERFIGESGVPFLQGIDLGLKAVGHLMAHAEVLRAAHTDALRAKRPAPAAAKPKTLDLGAGLHGLAAIGGLLERHGVPVSPWRLARTADEAAAAGDALGYPVALKVESADVSHKSDAGGVRLELGDAAAVREAWNAMRTEVGRKAPGARIDGALVARMAEPGLEMSIGIQRDPQFGHALMVGLGGVWIEVLGDVSLRLAPVDEAEALAMLAELKAAPLLAAFRGAKPRDTKALAKAMVGLSRFATEHGPRIESIEVNPLFVYEGGRGVLAVDARLVLDR